MGPVTTTTDAGNAVMRFTKSQESCTGDKVSLARVEVCVLCFDTLIQCTEIKPERLIWIYA